MKSQLFKKKKKNDTEILPYSRQNGYHENKKQAGCCGTCLKSQHKGEWGKRIIKFNTSLGYTVRPCLKSLTQEKFLFHNFYSFYKLKKKNHWTPMCQITN
jgi:hypothetical protein